MDIATLGIAVRSDQVDDANRSLERFSQVSGSAERAAKGVGSEASKAGRMAQVANDNAAGSAARAAAAYGRWEVVARRVGTAIGALAGALATGALIQYADAWSDMQSRVGAAIRDMEAAPQMMQRVVDIANASYSPLSQTVEIFSRNVATLRDLGRGANDAANFTEALNNALIINAAKGQDAQVVLNSFSRAIATGALNAQDFDTIISRAPRLLEAVADELGTNTSALRALAQEGQVTSDVMVRGLLNSFDRLRAEAEEMPATVGDAFVILRNNLTAFIGQMDQATGSSAALSAAIMVVANNIDTIARVAAIAGVALLTAFAPAILAAMASGLTAIGVAGVAAMRALTIAIMANPLGALAVAITTAITAVYMFRDEIKSAIGIDVVAVVQQAMNTVIGALVGAYDAAMATWRQLPAALGDLGFQAAQKFLDGIVWMAREAVSIINGLISSINGSLRGVGLDGLQIPDLGAPVKTVPSARLNNPYAGSAAGVGNAASEAFSAAMARDYVGATKVAVEATRTATDAIDDMNRAMGEVSGGSGGAGGGGRGSAGAAAKAIKDVAAEADKAAQAAADFVNETAKGFLNDLRSGLEQGKGFFRSFADAAVNALNRIADRLMNMAIDGLFSSSAGGGGIFQSLFGGIGKLFGFSSGGWTGNGSRSGVAGVVHGQEYVVRAGPAAQHRQMLEAMNSNRPLPANTNQPQHVVVEVRGTFVDDNGVIKSQVTSMGQQAAQAGATVAVRQVKQALPSMIADSQARKM